MSNRITAGSVVFGLRRSSSRHGVVVALGCFIVLLASACNESAAMVAPRVANPTGRGVICDVKEREDAGMREASCRATFEGCSDGLHYELECNESMCDCIVDGDKLGEFEVTGDSACEVDIAELKVRCGWNPAR